MTFTTNLTIWYMNLLLYLSFTTRDKIFMTLVSIFLLLLKIFFTNLDIFSRFSIFSGVVYTAQSFIALAISINCVFVNFYIGSEITWPGLLCTWHVLIVGVTGFRERFYCVYGSRYYARNSIKNLNELYMLINSFFLVSCSVYLEATN